jgi:two-component system response regulator AtoC
MAGSHSPKSPAQSFEDPILTARLDAIQQLAGGLSDRVMVLDRELRIVYANEAAWAVGPDFRHDAPPARCFEAFLHRSDPCEACAASKLFESPGVSSVSCAASGDGTACGMHQAFPLLSGLGETASVLVLFKKEANQRPQTQDEPREDTTTSVSPDAAECQLGAMIGKSRPMRQLFEMIRLVADSEATVLIQGESGTGKELVARTIHRLSSRREQPFVVVDCGSLPESLLESELFGHVKGAFTGAQVTRRGLFEEADGGTIFLDEIGDTSLHFQSKLLRVLQEGEIKPVGSSRSIKVDVRVVSASNRELSELVKSKAFREDLYYRLAVLPLLLPPLRERREDIPLLVEHFLAISAERHRKPLPAVSLDALQALKQAPWSGNIRELQHLIERVVVTAVQSRLTAQDFFGTSTPPAPEPDLRTVARGAAREVEQSRIREALRQTGGNRLKAARLLRISRASLYNKLRAYDIHEE